MRAALVTELGAPLVLTELPQPPIGDHDALIEVKACGMCFTDLRIADELGGPLLPLTLGHESTGVVAAVGSGVAGVAVGDRVGVHALFTCGVCEYCTVGEEEACVEGFTRLAGLGLPGGYGQFMRAPADHLIALPDELDFAEAAPFFCAGLTSYAALKNAGVHSGQRVVVIGVGGLGHLAISIAAAMGAEVYAVTTSPDKADLARTRGAVFVGDVGTVAAELAGAGGAHVVLNTANSLDSVASILPGMAKQSTIVLAAADGDVLPIPPFWFTALQLRVLGSFYGSRQDVRELLDLAVEYGIRADIERFALEDVNEAHSRLRANAVRYRAVLEH